jgi:hypothetical protein
MTWRRRGGSFLKVLANGANFSTFAKVLAPFRSSSPEANSMMFSIAFPAMRPGVFIG